MTSKPFEPEQPKKPYRKPAFIQIALRPEEAVLGFCKHAAGAGPGNSTCNAVGKCFGLGS